MAGLANACHGRKRWSERWAQVLTLFAMSTFRVKAMMLYTPSYENPRFALKKPIIEPKKYML